MSSKMRKKKIFIYGKHGKRTPFSYPEYREKFSHYFEYVDAPEQAEYLIVGYNSDLKNNIEYLSNLVRSSKGLKLIVFSEEPLWDTLWSGNFQEKHGQIKCVINEEELQLEYFVINHVTSKVFQFENIPYFLTTSNDYYLRYNNLFSRNAKLKTTDFENIWEQAQIKYAFFAEKRFNKTYEASYNNGSILGLSKYRTLVASKINSSNMIKKGQGWDSKPKRQVLPDWHLDKLATLNGHSFIVSALENTHLSNYITEKPFDAFAVKAIPLYYAHPKHDIFRLVEEGSFINLSGLSVEESLEKMNEFRVNHEFTDRYLSSQVNLSKLFSDPKIYLNERNRIVDETVKIFSEL